jgi:uncharacterized BrkB/YihY/UPF0761 family membrane protein
MATAYYLTGVLFAILAGVSTYLGLALQKKVVNEIPREKRGKGFMRTLLKRPLWNLGLFLYIGLASAFFMIAQYMIGRPPAACARCDRLPLSTRVHKWAPRRG